MVDIAPLRFGIVTMATDENSAIRASALAASLRIHEPDVPLTILLPRDLKPPQDRFSEVRFFDRPEPFNGALRYLNKLVHPFVLTPYERTLFLDDDTLVVRPFAKRILESFSGRTLGINTRIDGPSTPREGTNHLDPAVVCEELGTTSCLNTFGGGHMYFESRGQVPELAQEAIRVATEERALYQRWSRQEIISDEIALLIAANRLTIDMPSLPDFVDALSLRAAMTRARFDVGRSHYRLDGRHWGVDASDVCILHFCSSAKLAFNYSTEIYRLTGLRQSFDRGLGGRCRRSGHRLLRAQSKLRRLTQKTDRAPEA